jgi:hypothetical protein
MTSPASNPDERPVLSEDEPFGGLSNRPLPLWGVALVAILGTGLGVFFWKVTGPFKAPVPFWSFWLYAYVLAKAMALITWTFVVLVVGWAYDRHKELRAVREKAISGEPMEPMNVSLEDLHTQAEALAKAEKWRSLDALARKAPVAVQLAWVERYGVQKLPAIAERLRDAKVAGAPVRQPSGSNPLWLLPFLLVFPLLGMLLEHESQLDQTTIAKMVPLLEQTVVQSPAQAKRTLAIPANAALIQTLDGFVVEDHRGQTVFKWSMGSDTCDEFYAYLKTHPGVLDSWVLLEDDWPSNMSSLYCWNDRGRRTELHFTITATQEALSSHRKTLSSDPQK